MEIEFKGNYKSLGPFKSSKLEKFTVVTGKNGSGKSQLVELIEAFKSANPQISRFFSISPNINKIQIEGLEDLNNNSVNRDKNWQSSIDGVANDFLSLGEYTKKFIGVLMQLDTQILKSQNNSKQFRKCLSELTISRKDLNSIIINASFEYQKTNPIVSHDDEDLTHLAIGLKNRLAYLFSSHAFIPLVSKILSNKTLDEIKDIKISDFYLTPVKENLKNSLHFFGLQLDFIFYNYAKRRDQNRILFMEKNVNDEQNNSIPDDEFVKKYLPPWELLNNLLLSNNMNFKFLEVNPKDFPYTKVASPQLLKVSHNVQVPFHSLSSGEKIIIGLIIKLFISSYYDGNLILPELIVFDEPDAHLHPEMALLLINVLNETFVKKLNINVIVTTHSPSTIALCPEDSIYQIQNYPQTKLFKIEKDYALKLLTGFIPNLSINYKNHRQIFTEGSDDRFYYQTIFNKLNQDKKFSHELYFINNGDSTCQKVKKIVRELHESGSNSVYGVIDWDLKNSNENFTLVHGKDSRYTIENYLYDPIYLIIYFLENKTNDIHSNLGIEESFNQYHLIKNSHLVEKSLKWFFDTFFLFNKISEESKFRTKSIRYYDGSEIDLPIWYLEMKGHVLEDKLFNTFSILSNKFGQNKSKLKEELTNISAKCYPFIHQDTVDLINELTKVKQ